MSSNLALLDKSVPRDRASSSMERFETDVLVIGAGISGSFAALEAQKYGVRAAIVDKAWVHRSGSAGAGTDHWSFFLNQGEQWDTPDAFNKWNVEVGFCDYGVVNNVVTRKIPEVLTRLEELGVEFLRDPKTGKYLRTVSFARPGPWAMMSNNSDILEPALGVKLRRSGITVLDWTMITSLLKDRNGRVAGAVGFHTRSGNVRIIRSKTVILAAGVGSRMTANSTGNPFNCYINPYNTGSAQALTLIAGAELVDMEFGMASLVPKGFGAPGMNALSGMGCYLINGKGERYMMKYHKMAEKAPRDVIVAASMKETSEGRGPVYWDARHLTEKDREFLLKNLLTVDKPLLKQYFDGKKIDLAKDPLEMEVSENTNHAGIFVDENSETNVKGLYAAGACASVYAVGVAGGTTCIASGISAGESAAIASKDQAWSEVSDEQIEDATRSVYGPFESDGALSPTEFLSKMLSITSVLMKYSDAGSLRNAEEELRKLEAVKIKAKNLHELMRAQEANHRLLAARATVVSAMERKETRYFHHRSDYPETDPSLYDLHLGVKLLAGKFVTRLFPRDLGPYEPTEEKRVVVR